MYSLSLSPSLPLLSLSLSLSLSPDPNETAQDMINAYQRECMLMKIKPIQILLDQLKVSRYNHYLGNVEMHHFL